MHVAVVRRLGRGIQHCSQRDHAVNAVPALPGLKSEMTHAPLYSSNEQSVATEAASRFLKPSVIACGNEACIRMPVASDAAVRFDDARARVPAPAGDQRRPQRRARAHAAHPVHGVWVVRRTHTSGAWIAEAGKAIRGSEAATG